MYILTALTHAPATNNTNEDLMLEAGQSCFISESDVNYYRSHPAVYTVTEVSPIGVDANGRVSANVNLRTDTLVNLLSLAGGGGVSEVGRASDTDALVLFNGVEGGQVPFFRSHTVAKAIARVTSTAQTAGAGTTYTPVVFETNAEISVYPNAEVINPADGSEILIPVGCNTIHVHGTAQWAASASGTGRRVAIEYYNGSIWVMGVFATLTTVPPTTSFSAAFDLVYKFLDTATKLRFSAASDANPAVNFVPAAGSTQITIDMLRT